ncbi:MAG: hypothetical protein H6554_03955 [Chitinophagales bacterium]|nr:hypothetical protein [Chitinophagales bacterium]
MLTDGEAPYEVLYDGLSVGSFSSTTFTVGTLLADNITHNITILDVNGCSMSGTVTAPDPTTCTNTCSDEVGTTSASYAYCVDGAPANISLSVNNPVLNGPPPQIGWASGTAPITSSTQISTANFEGSGTLYLLPHQQQQVRIIIPHFKCYRSGYHYHRRKLSRLWQSYSRGCSRGNKYCKCYAYLFRIR